jgi:hypothetical protein
MKSDDETKDFVLKGKSMRGLPRRTETSPSELINQMNPVPAMSQAITENYNAPNYLIPNVNSSTTMKVV